MTKNIKPFNIIRFIIVPILVVVFSIPVDSGTESAGTEFDCEGIYKINWPDRDTIWSFCWVPPDKSFGIDGSGLEIYNAFYRGKKVFHEAHLPVLNVIYKPNPFCGPTYRDWTNDLIEFQADNVISKGYAEPVNPPKTVCDHPGHDAGQFEGVAVEKKPDVLILTTQMEAGWYRYIQKLHFLPNGIIRSTIGFTAVKDPCVKKLHSHHAYWRFDFDIDGAENDVIEEYNKDSGWKSLNLETKSNNNYDKGRKWRVRDQITGRGYEIIPDQISGVADRWADADMWALMYNELERDDGGATSGEFVDQIHTSKYLNSEDIYSKDVVIWNRAGVLHNVPSLNEIGCEILGPTLKPFGSWERLNDTIIG